MADIDYDKLSEAIRRGQENSAMTKPIGKGGADVSGAGAAMASVMNKAVSGLGNLAAGTATSKDVLDLTTGVMSKFGSAGQVAGNAVGQLGEGILNVNSTLRETGKYGISFGQNLGEANAAVKNAQLTMPEFQSMVQSSGKSLAGLAGGQNESAKAFLKVAAEMQQTDAAQTLKAAGMSSLELNDAMLLASQNTIGVNLKDKASREGLIAASLVLADEMNQVADISGKSRKQQADAIKAIQERADVEAAVLLKQKTDPNFGKNMDAATAAMGKFGPKIQELLAEEATDGARSQDALKTKALMGPAAEAIAAYGKAIDAGNPEQIAAAKKKAEIAVAERMNSEEYLKAIKVTQGNVLNGGELVKGSFETMKNIQAEQAELARQGRNASVEAAMASIEEKNKLKTKGEVKTEEGKTKTDEGAIVGRSINQIENLGKVAGGVVADQFNNLNTRVGKTVNESLPQLDAKIKSLSSPEGLTKAVESGIKSGATSLGATPANVTPRVRELVKAGPENAAKIPKQADGSKDVFGDWFGKDWGAGGLSYLHGKEAVVPQGKIGEFISDMTKKMPVPNKKGSGLDEMMSGFMDGAKNMDGPAESVAAKIKQAMPATPKIPSESKVPTEISQVVSEMSKGVQSSLENMKSTMPQLMTDMMSKAKQASAVPEAPPMPAVSPVPQGDTMNEVVKLLEMLNKQMGELIGHTSDVADLSGKQVRATRGLSNNRLAV